MLVVKSFMFKYITSIFLLIFLTFITCKKQNTDSISEVRTIEIYPIDEPVIRNFESLPATPAGLYNRGTEYGTAYVFAPDGKVICAYNSEIFETPWGPVYDAPVLYLYDKENKILATYNVFELIFKKHGGGEIQTTYNEKRNSFDMVFSLDAYGNYGTAYIDLETNEFVRELLIIP